jgi:hypothetical protein
VKIISDFLGTMIVDPVTIDLGELDPATGRPLRTILKTTDADRYQTLIKRLGIRK